MPRALAGHTTCTCLPGEGWDFERRPISNGPRNRKDSSDSSSNLPPWSAHWEEDPFAPRAPGTGDLLCSRPLQHLHWVREGLDAKGTCETSARATRSYSRNAIRLPSLWRNWLRPEKSLEDRFVRELAPSGYQERSAELLGRGVESQMFHPREFAPGS